MKIHFLFFIIPFFFLRGFSQSSITRIDALMKHYYPYAEPGAVIAIQQHNKTIFKKGYGLADLRSGKQITPGENFNIGSLTKQFTAYAILTLYEQGKFSLSDSIGKFFSLSGPLASIRISQLLSHSSGIPDHYRFIDTNKIKHATDKDVLAAIQGADTLNFPSGTDYRYSNTAYCLLGMLIEKISGQTYASFIRQQLFLPLDIRDAVVLNINRPVKRRVTGYSRSAHGEFIKADAEESVFFSTEADGGIYMSMNDYMKWCKALESGKLSGTRAIRIAWQAQTPVDSLQGLWYGNGWFISLPRGTNTQKIVYHTGFNGGFRTVVFMIPARDYRISIFSNRSDIDLEDLVSRINQILQIPDNSFIKSGPFESFKYSWPKFAPCKETSSFSTLSIRNLNAKDMVLN